MSAENLEKRLLALEKEVSRLKVLVQENQPKKNWRVLIGTFLNDPYYEKAMKYGRQYRLSLRPKKVAKRKKTNGPS